MSINCTKEFSIEQLKNKIGILGNLIAKSNELSKKIGIMYNNNKFNDDYLEIAITNCKSLASKFEDNKKHVIELINNRKFTEACINVDTLIAYTTETINLQTQTYQRIISE